MAHKIIVFEVHDNKSPQAELPTERIKHLLEGMLRVRFPGNGRKQNVKVYLGRFNFACPYCGDSATDDKKKRGNLYPDGMAFKCYNCGKYGSALNMLREYGVDVPEDEANIMRIISASVSHDRAQTRAERSAQSIHLYTETDYSKVMVPRDALMRKLRLWEIKPDSPQGKYLLKRRQVLDQKFAWDNYSRRLFIFNLDISGDFVFGAQTRQFDAKDGDNKYLTYKIGKIRRDWMGEELNEEQTQELTALGDLSITFGVLKCDFSRMVTIFEGPMDHFMLENSAATCSINNEWPFDIGYRRFMQDNDATGSSFAFRKLVEGESVFLWRRFMRHHGLRGKKLKDLNDVRILEYVNNTKYDIEPFFSLDRRDLLDITSNDDTFGQAAKPKQEKWKNKNT